MAHIFFYYIMFTILSRLVIVENTTLMNGDAMGTDRKSPVLTIFISAQELSPKIHVMES